MPEEAPDLELRKEWTRLRALLYETHEVAVCTDGRDSHRWITDRYVLLDVTGSVAIQGVPDGCYKLVQSKGFQVREGYYNFLNGGIVDYLDNVERGARWYRVEATQWSVAEHPGKAMLLVVLNDRGEPCPVLMGESTWTTLHRHYEEPEVEYAPDTGRNLFRVTSFLNEGHVTKARRIVVAYVAGIRVPKGQEEIAYSIAKLTLDALSTSN